MNKLFHSYPQNKDKPRPTVTKEEALYMADCLNIPTERTIGRYLEDSEDKELFYHGKLLPIPDDLPVFGEKEAQMLNECEKNIRDKKILESITRKIGTAEMLTDKIAKNGTKLLEYFKSCGKEFAMCFDTPYFYNESNGVWYPFTTSDGTYKFRSSLDIKERELVDLDAVGRLIDAIRSDSSIAALHFEKVNPYLLNFKDGVFDIENETILEHNSSYMFTYCLNATTHQIKSDYHGGEMLLQYLNKSFGDSDEQIATLSEIFGVAISNVRDQKQMFFLYGPSSSGKSVALNILNGLICDEFVSSLSFRQFSGKFELSEMAGSCLNLSSEIPAIKGKTADVLKRITGNDAIHAERKGKTGFKTRIHALLVFATNILPQVADDDEAFYSRFRVLKYDHSIPKSEWINNLEDSILEHELGYVLRFAIEGLKRYIGNGMEISAKEESDSYVYHTRIEENSFTDFINQFIVASDDGILLNAELYEAYYDYCNRNRLDMVKVERICHQALVARFNAKPDRFGKRRDRGFRGIKLCYNTDNTCL